MEKENQKITKKREVNLLVDGLKYPRQKRVKAS